MTTAWDITGEELCELFPSLAEEIEEAWPHLSLSIPITANRLQSLELLTPDELIEVLLNDDEKGTRDYRQRRNATTTRADYLALRDSTLTKLLALHSGATKESDT